MSGREGEHDVSLKGSEGTHYISLSKSAHQKIFQSLQYAIPARNAGMGPFSRIAPTFSHLREFGYLSILLRTNEESYFRSNPVRVQSTDSSGQDLWSHFFANPDVASRVEKNLHAA